jgi:3-deoxy-D-manno-octulosonate 8-phosphate phosphatase KdsC-like HAD superfamily phosphatase
MDTGRTDRDRYVDADGNPIEEMQSMEIYVAISTNRGLSFSQRRYRKLGIAGHNNKVIEWRNLGSGNSALFEFGTSSLHKLQIYSMGVDVQ